MSQNRIETVSLSKPALLVIVLVAATLGGVMTYLLLPEPDPVTPVTPVAKELLPPPVVIKEESKPKKPAVVAKQSTPRPATNKVKKLEGFVIKGLISTAGEPWSANLLRAKLLWLKNSGKQEFLLGHENAQVQLTKHGLAYQFVLRPQPATHVSFNGGVEGNIARVMAFVDYNQDGKLTPGKDRIIAVSNELLRYRTGRYDNKVLNPAQVSNIKKAGKGYVFIRNEPDADGKMDWRVVADTSPVRLDLSASKTSLPNMYNTFLKLR